MLDTDISLPFLDPKKIFFVKGILDNKISYPWSLEIQPTDKCNLECNFCAYKKRRKRNNSNLSPQIFNEIIESIRKMRVKGVYISGGGEPLIWSSKKNKISDYINRLSKVSHVAVITNGIKINKDTFNSFKNIFYVLFSFFDTNFENNKKTTKMTKTNFNILLKNIKDLARYKDKNKIKRPFLGIKTVITPENYKNTMSIYRDIKRINVDYHIFRLAVDFENSMKPYINSKQYKSMMNKIKLEWKVIDEKYTNIKQIFDCDNPAIKGECWIVKKGLYCCIDANGDVYPCLYYVGDSKYCIGNIYKEKLENIWKSKKHREIIKKLNDISKRGECPSFCRFKRYNQLIEKINYFKIPNQKDYNKMHASFI